MSNLLQIEQNFLRTEAVQVGLKLRDAKRLMTSDANAQKKKFEISLELSKVVAEGFAWFKSDAGKATMAEEGIAWTADDFAQKVYGWQKSFMYKMVKAGSTEVQVIERYKETTESRTIEGLLKFAKDSAEGAGSGEGEGKGEGESRQRPTILFSFTCKTEDGQEVKIKVKTDGTFKAEGDKVDIQSALKELTKFVNEATF